jgi:hypothetical protein
MATAVVPFRAFREKFSLAEDDDISLQLQDLVQQFLHDTAPAERRREPVRS